MQSSSLFTHALTQPRRRGKYYNRLGDLLQLVGRFLHPSDIDLGSKAESPVLKAGWRSFAWARATGAIHNNGNDFEFEADVYGLGQMGVFLALNRGPVPTVFFGPAQPDVDICDPDDLDAAIMRESIETRTELIVNNSELLQRPDQYAMHIAHAVGWAEQTQGVLVLRDPDSGALSFDWTGGAKCCIADIGLLVLCLIGLGLKGDA